MGPGREASEASRGGGVSGPKGVSDLEEKAQEEQQELMRALIGTLHHFWGGFSPSVCPRHRPPKSDEDPLSSCKSCLRRGYDVSVSAQSETTD